MALQANPIKPNTLHIDLNSCFASIEQQANPLLRNKPLGIVSYNTNKGIILSPSIEAKRLGIKTGMPVFEAKKIHPQMIFKPTDTEKYRVIHKKFINLLRQYSPEVYPKSIDEAVLYFNHLPTSQRSLEETALQIKKQMQIDLGDWIKASIGISTNQFLAKTAASFQKPDGLTIIDKQNLLDIYSQLQLLDLNGINHANQKRLHTSGIFTVLDLYNTSLQKLHYQVFQSTVAAYHWYHKLRGYETEKTTSTRKTIGHSYSLQHKTTNREELKSLLIKLCEKTGRRLRRNQLYSQGLSLYIRYTDHTSWHLSRKIDYHLYSTTDIYQQTISLLNQESSPTKEVGLLAVTCFNLNPYYPEQLSLFNDQSSNISNALDQINNRFGEFTITTAKMMYMQNTIVDRIAFGGIKDLKY